MDAAVFGIDPLTGKAEGVGVVADPERQIPYLGLIARI
jgi:hypothetical protein